MRFKRKCLTMLSVENAYFAYGEKKILEGVSLSAAVGEIVALIGLSGSGKTTLFRLITGIASPSSGKILIAGKPHPHATSLVTYMRQDDLLLPWRTVMGNLVLLAEMGKGGDKVCMGEEAKLLLKWVGLEGCEHLYPHQLSGGMRQKVALARSLLQDRPLILLDEPFASLDLIIREQLYTCLRKIRDHYQKTIIMVTHDFRDAFTLADRILLLRKGKITANYSLPISCAERAKKSEGLLEKIREHLREGFDSPTFPFS